MGDRFSFSPSDGALIVSGDIAADDSFSGSLVPGSSHQDHTGASPFTLTVAGRLDDRAATGTFVTPRCRTAFRLSRIDATLLP